MNLRDVLSFTFPKALPREFGGERILVSPRADMRILKSGWRGVAYDLMLVARNYVTPGMVVWDIGANQGIFSFLAAYRTGVHGAVYALEADPKYADQIFRSNQRVSKRYSPVDVMCAAIGETASFARLQVSKRGHTRNHLVSSEHVSTEKHLKSVPLVTGDSLLDFWRPPDVIKLDVEEYEIFALSGMLRILSEIKPIIYVEVAKENSPVATRILKEHGYSINHLKGNGLLEPVSECTFYTMAVPPNFDAG